MIGPVKRFSKSRWYHTIAFVLTAIIGACSVALIAFAPNGKRRQEWWAGACLILLSSITFGMTLLATTHMCLKLTCEPTGQGKTRMKEVEQTKRDFIVLWLTLCLTTMVVTVMYWTVWRQQLRTYSYALSTQVRCVRQTSSQPDSLTQNLEPDATDT